MEAGNRPIHMLISYRRRRPSGATCDFSHFKVVAVAPIVQPPDWEIPMPRRPVEPIGMVIGTMLFLSIPALFVMLY